MKTIVTLISLCLLLPLTCVHGGKVKTIDGKQMPKDSVAEMELAYQLGTVNTDSVLAVYVVAIDSVSIAQMEGVQNKPRGIIPGGVAFAPSSPEEPATIEYISAFSVGKGKLAAGNRVITVQCSRTYKGKHETTTRWSRQMNVTIQLVPEQKYGLKVTFLDGSWTVNFEDKATKMVAATASGKAELLRYQTVRR
jgi:hypothetical protein